MVIVHGVISHSEVNAQSVIGAITVYILLGMLFIFIYTVVAVIGDGPFFAQGTDGTLSLRLYFSFATLTTVGYGDYTAASNRRAHVRGHRGPHGSGLPRDRRRPPRQPDEAESQGAKGRWRGELTDRRGRHTSATEKGNHAQVRELLQLHR